MLIAGGDTYIISEKYCKGHGFYDEYLYIDWNPVKFKEFIRLIRLGPRLPNGVRFDEECEYFGIKFK